MNIKGKLLIVDDEPEILFYIKELLEQVSYLVYTALSSNEALEVLNDKSCDILITDIRMPGSDGIKLMEEATRLQPDILSIIITGHGDIESAIDALRLGAINYLRKPLNFEELEIAIDYGMEKLSLIREVREKQRQLEKGKDAAEAGNRVKSEFLANMSHEMRTPLNHIIGFSQIVMIAENLTGEQKEYLANVHNAADSLLSLVDGILSVSRIDKNKLPLEEQSFDLLELLESVTRFFLRQAEEKGLDLVSGVPAKAHGLLSGDHAKVRQILHNLIGNAIKFSGSGQVKVGAEVLFRREMKTFFQFSVADNGNGIAAEDQETIFDLFFQVDSSSTRFHGGTGLGLAICQKLVNLMGGEIWVESELGQGSTFYFTIPFREDIAAVPHA